MSSESDALQNRLRAMTIAQLRARWKRIEQHLRDPERVIGSALAARCLDEDSPNQQFTDLQDYAQLHAELHARPKPASDDEDARYEDQRQCQELGGRAASRLLQLEAHDELAKALLGSLGVDERLGRARELHQQMSLVAAELAQRGESTPDQDAPLMLLSRDSDSAGAGSLALSSSSSPALSTKVKEGTRSVIEKVGNNAEKLSDSAEKAGRGISERIAEATRNVANSAAQASGQALWSAATSAFRYGTRGPEKTPVPVKRAPRRPSRAESPSSDDALSLIERLFELKERGILSEEEFLAKKRELLERL